MKPRALATLLALFPLGLLASSMASPGEGCGPSAASAAAPQEPPSCPLCGGSGFGDLVLLLRLQQRVALLSTVVR